MRSKHDEDQTDAKRHRSRERSYRDTRSRRSRERHLDEKSSRRTRRSSRDDDGRHHETIRSKRGRSNEDDRRTGSSPEPTRTLCVRNFSSKLSVDEIQDKCYREFGRFGDLSISVGDLDGERAALITFKYSDDAREALKVKRTIYIHDRTLNVETLAHKVVAQPTFNRRSRSRSRSPGDNDRHHFTRHHERGHHHQVINTSHNFASLLPKPSNNTGGLLLPNPGGPNIPMSLLGGPATSGLTTSSTAMMAAAARALGLGGLPPGGPLLVPPPLPPTLTHHHPPISHIGPPFAPLPPPSTNRINPTRRGHHSPTNTTGVDPFHDSSSSATTRTLFVGSLDADITEREIIDLFGRYGLVEHVDIKRPPKPGGHYSYAFVRFANIDMALRAKQALSGSRIRSFHCKIGFGKPIPSTCLYISGIGPWMSADNLKRFALRHGPVLNFDWPVTRRYAQIRFETCEAATAASKALKLMPLGGTRGTQRPRIDFIDPNCMSPPQPLGSGGFNDSGSCNMSEVCSNNTLRQVISLSQLDQCLKPDLWHGQFRLKSNMIPFRCLHVVGDAEVGARLGKCGRDGDDGGGDNVTTVLRVVRRTTLDSDWSDQVTDSVQSALASRTRGLCLLLALPDSIEPGKQPSLRLLVAYLRLKQAVGIVATPDKLRTVDESEEQENGDPEAKATCQDQLAVVQLYTPSDFSLRLLKYAAPQLSPQLAVLDDYLVILAVMNR